MKITLYVDTVSPFAYEAYYILRHDPIFSKCDIEYVPVFLGGVMIACGNTPPIGIKNKDKWINSERLRWAKRFNIPMVESTPAGFPPLTLNIMRCVSALSILHPYSSDPHQVSLTKALDALFEAYWVQGRNTIDASIMTAVLTSALGEVETTKVLQMAPKQGKVRLLENTEMAVAQGAFGLPWFVCEDDKGNSQSFWGVDHLGCVVEFLGLEKSTKKEWRALL